MESFLKNDLLELRIEDEILIARLKAKVLTGEIAAKIVNERLAFSNNREYYMLSDIREVEDVTKEARDFLGSEKGSEGILAGAILVNSVIGSAIANFFMKLYKPSVPTKLFTEEEPAKKWLKAQFVERNSSLSA